MKAEFGTVQGLSITDMLSRAGWLPLDDAEKMIHGMAAAMYRSLIQACGVHGKLELGQRMIPQ
jgi:hypothetical protein